MHEEILIKAEQMNPCIDTPIPLTGNEEDLFKEIDKRLESGAKHIVIEISMNNYYHSNQTIQVLQDYARIGIVFVTAYNKTIVKSTIEWHYDII